MPIQKWEYAFVVSHGDDLHLIFPPKRPAKTTGDVPLLLHRLGEDGWELAGTLSDAGAQSYILKRPKQ